MNPAPTGLRLSMFQVLLRSAAIVTLGMGIRHGVGLWLQAITMERGWTRETFTFGLAVQNLARGLAGPFAGSLASICARRSVAIVAFLLLPLTPTSVYVFSAVMGLLWLSTVPPGNAVKAQISPGSDAVVWWIALALGVFAVLIKLPLREGPITRPVLRAA
jgi:hypothetical protein